jgi:hypothetical protein
MLEQGRALLIENIRGKREKDKKDYPPSPFAATGENQRIPIGEGIYIEQGFNGDGDFHFSIISADCVKDLSCVLTLHIKNIDGTAYLEAYVNEGDDLNDRQIYYSTKSLSSEEMAMFGSNVIFKPALRVSDGELRRFRELKRNPQENLETAKKLLRRLPR